VTGPIRFTVTLEGVRDARRLQQRNLVLSGGTGLVAVGLLLFVLGNSGGVVLVAIGILVVVEWQFPIFDRWFDRGRLIVGSVCDLWLDETALHWRQTRPGAFETTGQIDWSRISGLREDDRGILVMDGRVARIGIPKDAFASAESLADFRAEVHRRIVERRGSSGSATT
jgi:hypothetical protein